MFSLVTRHEKITIPPKYFDQNVEAQIEKALKKIVEYKFNSKSGHTLFVNKINDISLGIIQNDTSCAQFDVSYEILICKIIKDDIIPAIVTGITQQGIHATASQIAIYIPKNLIGDDLCFYDTSFSGQACFKAKENQQTQTEQHQQSQTEENKQKIEPEQNDTSIYCGKTILVKIIGYPKQMQTVLATIKGNFLG